MTDKDTLMNLIDEYAEVRHINGCWVYNSKTAAARQAVIEALSGVQALSAAPAGWKLVPVEPTNDMQKAADEWAAKGFDWPKAVYRAMLAASPTPPAEQQAEESLTKLLAECRDAFPIPEPGSPLEVQWAAAMARPDEVPEYARLCVAAMQAAPKAAPGESADSLAVPDNCPHILWFDEQDLKPVVFAGDGAKRAALEAYRKASMQWNAHLFVRIAVNSRDCLYPCAAPQQEAQEPTTVDKKTMELAESVGLIGPASRVGDLHAAIQRFHDLICVNATIKAAVMAADVIRGVATPARDYPPLPMQFACSGMFPVYSADQMRAYVDADRAAYAPASSQPAPAPLSEMPYEKRKAIQEGEQIGASDAWFKARHEMLDTVDRRNVFRAGFDRGWNAALAAQGGTP